MPLPRSGKENVRPSTSGVRREKTVFSHWEDFRGHLFSSSNDDRKKDSFRAKKTKFHVHHDETNDVEDRERFKRSKIISCGCGAKRREEYAAGSTQTKEDETEKKLLPSRIPRLFKPCADAPNSGSQGQTRCSPSAKLKTIRPEERCCKATDSKCGWSGRWLVAEQSKSKSFADEARGLIKKPVSDTKSSKHLVLGHKKLVSIRVPTTTNPIEKRKLKVTDNRISKLTVKTARISQQQTTSNILRPTRNAPITSNINIIEPKAIDRIKDNLLRPESRGRAHNTALRPESNTITPVDDNIPQTNILQGAIRKTGNVQGTQFQDIQATDSCQDDDYFPWQLRYHSDYRDELPMTEYERERQSLKLSKNFLEKNLNVKLRRLIVSFILRLGMLCRYPSFVVFQAVKLFDAAMDRMNVEVSYIQLVALTSLWIALKRHEHKHKIPKVTTMVSLAGNLYVDRQDLLIKFEQKILFTLNFNITFPDPFSLFTHYLFSCRDCVSLSEDAAIFISHIGGYLIDITLLDESLCRMPVCLITLSAMELALGLAIDTVGVSPRPRWLFWRDLLFTASPTFNGRSTYTSKSYNTKQWNSLAELVKVQLCQFVASFSKFICLNPGLFTDKAIDQIRIRILKCVINSAADHSDFSVVYEKYSHSKYGRVSTTLLERVCRISSSEMLMA